MEWKDTTSYARGERGEIDPRSWTLAGSSPPIVVHRHIHFPKDQWMLSVNRIGIDLKALSSTNIEEAKIEAVAFVREYLRATLARVPGAHTPDGEAVAHARQYCESCGCSGCRKLRETHPAD